MVFCCKINCRDRRSEAGVRFGVVGLVEPPEIGPNMQFVGPCTEKRMSVVTKPLPKRYIAKFHTYFHKFKHQTNSYKINHNLYVIP